MPIARVQLSDGRIGRFDVPEGTTPDQVESFVASQYQPPQNAPNPYMMALNTAAPNLGMAAQAISNIPESAGRFLGGIAQTIQHPLQTGMGVWDAAAGALHNALPSAVTNPIDTMFPSPATQRAVNTANAAGNFYRDRYGGLENVRNTVIQDPVGAMADVSAVAGIGGGALKLAGMPQAADVALNVSKYTNPLYLGGKAVTSVVKPVYKYAVGQTTGAGYTSIGEALKASKEFLDSMRGKTSETEVYQDAQDALQQMKDARAEQYLSKLRDLKNASQELDIEPIQARADQWLSQYNVRKAPDGTLNFNRSTLTGKAVQEVQDVYDMVQGWGSQSGDLTPAGLDILKRRLGDYYASERPSRAMVTSLSNNVRQTIVKSVPEYDVMTKDYAKMSGAIKDIQQALGLGTQAATDASLRKMLTAFREDRTFRRSIIQSLDETTDKNLMGSIAGLMLKPAGTMRIGPMIAGSMGAGGLLTLTHPGLAALIPLASPRLMGELSAKLGQFGKAAPYAQGTGITAYQMGRPFVDQEDTNGNQ